MKNYPKSRKDYSLFHNLLGLKIIDYKQEKCEMYLPKTEKILTPNGLLNHGICMAVCDYAGYFTACMLLSQGEYPSVYNSNISIFLRSVEGGLKIYTEAIGVGYGSTIIEVKAIDEAGNQIAQATTMVVEDTRDN